MASNASGDAVTYPPASQVTRNIVALEVGDRDQEGQSGDAADSVFNLPYWIYLRLPSRRPAAFQPTPPPVKVTAWRMLNTMVIFVFGMSKAVSTYLGYSTAPTTLDWIFGVIWALTSYWVGLLENESPTVAPWFFDYDLYSSGVLGFVIIRLLAMFWVAISLFAYTVVFFRLLDASSDISLPAVSFISGLLLMLEVLLGFSILLVAPHLPFRLPIPHLRLPRMGMFSRSDWSVAFLGWPQGFFALLVLLGGAPVFLRIVNLLPESVRNTPLLRDLGWTLSAIAYFTTGVAMCYIIYGLFHMVYRLCSERRRRAN